MDKSAICTILIGIREVCNLADIATNNVGEHDSTPRMKYIMVRLDNLYRALVQEG